MYQEDDNSKIKICGISCCIFIGIIFMSACWDTVEPTQYALICNSISKNCD